MKTDSTVVSFDHPDALDDPLSLVLREGARRLLAQAVEAEAEAFLSAMAGERLPNGRARVVRHGHGPERSIQTGLGPVAVRRAKLRDRGAGSGEERITFTSSILPKWARRTRSLDAVLPVLYLRGISTGDFQEALAALLGTDAPNLSPSVIARLKEDWQADYDRWQRRDLSARRYVYIWADGVYLQARMEDAAACMLVVIGATPDPQRVGEFEIAIDLGSDLRVRHVLFQLFDIEPHVLRHAEGCVFVDPPRLRHQCCMEGLVLALAGHGECDAGCVFGTGAEDRPLLEDKAQVRIGTGGFREHGCCLPAVGTVVVEELDQRDVTLGISQYGR